MSLGHELLSPVDAAWFRMEDRRDPADIASVMVFEDQLDEAKLRVLVAERLLAHRRFGRRVVDSFAGLTPPHWEDEANFTIDAHLHRVSLRAPGDAPLAALVSALMNEPIDFTRSPWSLTLVDRGAGGTALVARIHHCLGDGFALVDILLSLADGAPKDAPQRLADKAADGSGRPATHSTHSPFETLAFAGRESRDLLSSLGHLLLLPFDPPTRLRGKLTGERRVAWSDSIPFWRVRDLARARGATVNDVLMTALAGAYRRYMLEHGDPALPFRAIVPVNLRPPSAPVDHEHGNWFGLVFLELPVEVGPADERLMELKRSMDRIKATKEAVVALGILGMMGRSPLVVDHIAEELFGRKATVVVTNVPGPREPVFLAGSPIRDMWFWAPHPAGLASGASILSYAGKVRLGVRSDVGVVPDPDRIAAFFVEEIMNWSERPAKHALHA